MKSPASGRHDHGPDARHERATVALLLAKEGRDPLLQEIGRGVFAELIVANRRGRHGGAHRIGGLGHRI